MNQLTVIGRVGNDAELRYTQGGTPVLNFSIASSEKHKDLEKTTWFKTVIWGKLGESVGKYVTKGVQVACSGRLEEESFTAQDGSQKKGFVFVADRIRLISSPQEKTAQPPAQKNATKPYNTYGKKQQPAAAADLDIAF